MKKVVGKLVGRLLDLLGGKEQARVILLLAATLGLDAADKGAIGAMAPQLQDAFGIGQAQLGLLATLSMVVGAVATLPFGWLTDRTRRIRLLMVAILLWGAVMVASAAAPSYSFLLFSRLALGMVVAAAGPAIASLLGDYFPPRRRARVYGYVLAGEFVGTGVGYVVAGELALIDWRVGFLGLVVPAVLLAWQVHRLPEPARGGAESSLPGQGSPARRRPGLEKRQGPPPRSELVLEEDPERRSLWWAVRYVLMIPTNRVLIVASALGYYFFEGARIFGLEYFEQDFHLGHSAALGLLMLLGTGALFGVLVGGRVGDHLLRRGKTSGRVITAVVAYFIAATLMLVGLLVNRLAVTAPAIFLAAGALGAVNPPLDAARLDIMHHRLWGRAESVRTVLRQAAVAAAPLLFGFVSGDLLGGGTAALRYTFLIMLVPLFAGGVIGLRGIRTYPRDVATAAASTRATGGPD